METESKERTVNTRDLIVKELKITGDKGDYIFQIPIGSQLEESLDVAGVFTSLISQSLQKIKEREEENPEEILTSVEDEQCSNK